MDEIENPFSPGAGSPPPELAGRDPILEQGRVLFGRVKRGRAEKSLLLTGLRGVGKTVLLNELARRAEAESFRVLLVEAEEDKPLAATLIPPLRRLLFGLDRVKGAGDKVRRSLAVLRSFMGAIKLSASAGDLTYELGIDPELGTADTGDLSVDLPDLFQVIAEAAADRSTPVALLIDEVQYFRSNELSALIMAMHRLQQRQLPMVLVGGGLPILPELAGDAKSYAERLFTFPDVGALSPVDAARALQEPVQEQGVNFTADALAAVVDVTQGYPYFLQEWGYQAWNLAEASPIDVGLIRRVTPLATRRLDESFFRVRFDRLTAKEKEVIHAMANLGPGPHRTGEVADKLETTPSGLSTVRANLIKKGMIYSPAYGDLAFTVPLFDEFLLRVMPRTDRA